MTVLDLILANLSGLTTLGSELYCTSTTIEDSDAKSTTMCCVISTYLDSIHVPEHIAIVRDTYSYVESLSEEDLAKASEILTAKEIEFEIPKLQDKTEPPKVYQKTNEKESKK